MKYTEGRMKKYAVNVLMFIMLIGLVSCSDFFTKFDSYVTDLKFEGSNYSVKAGEMVMLTLAATPSDSFGYYEPEYKISDESICSIVDRDGKYIFVKGYREGSVIITASMGNQSAKCILKVKEDD